MKYYLVCVGIVFTLYTSIAQDYTKNWVFGEGVTITFESPNNISSTFKQVPLNAQEGSSCISDNTGKLLLYTDGNTIWNGNNDVVDNGTGLNAYQTSTQTSIIIKQSLSTNIFYVFTNHIENGLYYSAVDISASSGKGAVLEKNIKIFDSVNEKLTACNHQNGKDVWLISHSLIGDAFISFLISESGISTPVFSYIGHNYDGHNSDFIGSLKASPNGRFLGNAISMLSIAELLYFNNQTGKVYNALTLSDTLNGPYGVEFTRDNSKVLFTSWIEGATYIWDIKKAVSNDFTIDTILKTPFLGGSLQLAIDSAIYFTGYKYIGRITFGTDGNFSLNDTFIKIPPPFNTSYGTPNFNTSYFYIPGPLDSINLPAETLPKIYVPTALTVNNDGLNEYISFEDYELSFFTIEIFNRWGQLIFSSNDKKERFYGTELPQSVYIVKIIYSLNPNDPNEIQKYYGSLTLLKN